MQTLGGAHSKVSPQVFRVEFFFSFFSGGFFPAQGFCFLSGTKGLSNSIAQLELTISEV